MLAEIWSERRRSLRIIMFSTHPKHQWPSSTLPCKVHKFIRVHIWRQSAHVGCLRLQIVVCACKLLPRFWVFYFCFSSRAATNNRRPKCSSNLVTHTHTPTMTSSPIDAACLKYSIRDKFALITMMGKMGKRRWRAPRLSGWAIQLAVIGLRQWGH